MKVSFLVKEAITYVIVILLLMSNLGTAFGLNSYPSSYDWSFQNYSYLGFNQAINFATNPNQGVSNDSSLVGYWNMNENSGSVAYDLSCNGNNGTLFNSPTWVEGKFGSALSFNGLNYVEIPNNLSLQLLGDCSIFSWINPNSLGRQCILEKYWKNEYSLFLGSNRLEFQQGDPWQSKFSNIFQFQVGTWYNIGITRQNNAVTFYINGVEYGTVNFTNSISISNRPLRMGEDGDGSNARFNGIIDDVRIYNRALSASGVAALYHQPDPVPLSNYYNYQDPVTNNTLLIHVDNPNGNSNNIVLVTCTNFFEDNRLAFQANSSAIVNVWTNLGHPVFTSGVWNSENYTTTLTFDASSTAEIQWNSGTPPSTSSLSASSTTGGKTEVFSALWNDNQSLSGGGYIFSTNNTGQWVNASWAPFPSTPCWGNVTLTLNSNVGGTVGFREFANNSLNLWGDSGTYSITITNDTSLATLTPTPTSASTASPTPTTSSVSTPTSTTTSKPTANPTTTPTLQLETNQFPIQTAAITATAVAMLVAVFAMFVLGFKKGYIKIEVVDEEQEGKDQEENQDYSI